MNPMLLTSSRTRNLSPLSLNCLSKRGLPIKIKVKTRKYSFKILNRQERYPPEAIRIETTRAQRRTLLRSITVWPIWFLNSL